MRKVFWSNNSTDFQEYTFNDKEFDPNESFEGVRISSTPEQIKACYIDLRGDT